MTMTWPSGRHGLVGNIYPSGRPATMDHMPMWIICLPYLVPFSPIQPNCLHWPCLAPVCHISSSLGTFSMLSHVWLCLKTFGPEWPHLAPFDPGWPHLTRLTLFEPVCVTTFNSISPHLTPFVPVWPCFANCGPILTGTVIIKLICRWIELGKKE